MSFFLQLPPEILGYISVFCFREFRGLCRHTRNTAYPWGAPCSCKFPNKCEKHSISALKRTQTNCLILGTPVNFKWEQGNLQNAFVVACWKGNLTVAKYITSLVDFKHESRCCCEAKRYEEFQR